MKARIVEALILFVLIAVAIAFSLVLVLDTSSVPLRICCLAILFIDIACITRGFTIAEILEALTEEMEEDDDEIE